MAELMESTARCRFIKPSKSRDCAPSRLFEKTAQGAVALFTQLIYLATQLWSMRVPAFTGFRPNPSGAIA